MSKPDIKLASKYTKEERAAFRAAYAPVVKRWKRLCAAFYVVVICGILSAFFVFGFKDAGFGPVFGLIAMAIITGLLTHYFASPRCPACGNRMQDTVKRFCPDCGSDDIQFPKHPLLGGSPHCRHCNKDLAYGDEDRNFKYKHCTCCGLFVDPKGL